MANKEGESSLKLRVSCPSPARMHEGIYLIFARTISLLVGILTWKTYLLDERSVQCPIAPDGYMI